VGHRKIAALMRADGHLASDSTVERALRRRGLLLPVGFRADRKSWAALRRKVFFDPPTARNRVWQSDFSEFETSRGGIWRICAVVDYAKKYCLDMTVTPTSRGTDARNCLQGAVTEAQRLLGLDDLRDDRGLMDLLDDDETVIGEIPAPIAVVTDNGPCFKGVDYAEAFTGDDPLLRHVRTRGQKPSDQRCRRTLLRHPQIRTPLSRRNRRHRRAGKWKLPDSATSTAPSDPTKPSATGHP
jgi:putative transposase